MKLLVDMNLPPSWVEVFKKEGWQAVHWSAVGDPDATDRAILDWARAHGYLVFTHDLDHGTILALTRAVGPSLVQIRTQDIMPETLGPRLVQTLKHFEPLLAKGALITVDETRSRVRILPIK